MEKYTIHTTEIPPFGQTEYRIVNSDGEASPTLLGDVRFVPKIGNFHNIAEISGPSFRFVSVAQAETFMLALMQAITQLKEAQK